MATVAGVLVVVYDYNIHGSNQFPSLSSSKKEREFKVALALGEGTVIREWKIPGHLPCICRNHDSLMQVFFLLLLFTFIIIVLALS